MMTAARRDYERAETHLALADSVEDFIRGAAVNKGMTLVKSAEEASLVVQITGRRYDAKAGVYDPKYFVRFRLSPGAKMTTERFVELTQGYKWTSVFSKAFSRPKPGAMWGRRRGRFSRVAQKRRGDRPRRGRKLHQSDDGSGEEEQMTERRRRWSSPAFLLDS